MRIVPIAVTACLAMLNLTLGHAQDAKGTGGRKTVNSAKSQIDPLASFEAIVKRFEKFFASPKQLVYLQRFPDSPSGQISAVAEYTARKLAFDVQRTDSLVSPYTAEINAEFDSISNGSCGSVIGYKEPMGWPTVQEAVAAKDRKECFVPDKSRLAHRVMFSFAFQSRRWVLKHVYFNEGRRHDHWELSPTFGFAAGNALIPEDPAAKPLNDRWRKLVE